MKNLTRRINGRNRNKVCAHCGRDLYRGLSPKCPHCMASPTVKHDTGPEDLCGCARAKPQSTEQKAEKKEPKEAIEE